ncbi:hypothetical protein HYH02_010628 [Chlamydomonas schloesseri]|uniref:Uncharacterized protein n=1 Tax=Chlamydomonas schloesseri TaxID=2026947 RepID=A0A835W8I4_9CHLO|nr:hypothetical protein HYH02_010628 [Chlamydomonas schloesseri]|eukprot:KAG2439751.1 hypothetical protein HYH02_010628 [Chlamydomonas schloesseri]
MSALGIERQCSGPAGPSPRCTAIGNSVAARSPHLRSGSRRSSAAPSRGRAGSIATASAASAGELSSDDGYAAAARDWTVPAAVLPGVAALASLPLRGLGEAALAQANAVAVLGAALAFLLYFASSLTDAAQPAVSRLAASLRPRREQLLRGAAWAAGLQAGLAALLVARHPAPHGEGALLPLYVAGYVCVGLLAGSLGKRRLRSRKRFELEAGEGERHGVMAQGALLAARNYAATILTVHLTAQAAAGAAAAVAGAAGAGAVAGAQAAQAAGLLLPPPLLVAYGVLALGCGAAVAFRCVPSLQNGKSSSEAL